MANTKIVLCYPDETKEDETEVDGGGNPIIRNRWGHYVLEHPVSKKRAAFRRVTTFTSVLDDTYQLNLWKQRKLAEGLKRRPEFLELVSGNISEDNVIVNLALKAGGANDAAGEGVRIHKLLAEYDNGSDFLNEDNISRLSDDDENVIDVWQSGLENVGLETRGGFDGWIERVVVIPRFGCVTEMCRFGGNG